MNRIKAVIMAGGSGSRLWPLSRAEHPKQFLPLCGKETMLQETINRISGLNIDSTLVICNENHRFFVAEQLREINKLDSILLEPEGRNTAPAVALAALISDEDDILLVLPADHFIQNDGGFIKAVNDAIPLAQSGKLVTFGVIPNDAHTGYGYIKKGEELGPGYSVEQFIEKPSLEMARSYVNSGEYYWNSGMFLFRAGSYLDELKKYRPDIYSACQLAASRINSDLDFLRVGHDEFKLCPSESIDYAVMEKTNESMVVPINVGWSDIGSWSSLWDASDKDSNLNFSNGDVVIHDSRNSYVRSDNQLVAVVGVDDLVVVSTKDAVLVAHKDSVQNVKNIVEDLKGNMRSEWQSNREVHRPWGKYDSIGVGQRYQVKKITVKPNAKLSVQLHNHRAEHWVVVSGEAWVTRGDETYSLKANESTFIPLGVVHALENTGAVDLELIEVQSGDYLGEDDIVRFEDKYGRE